MGLFVDGCLCALLGPDGRLFFKADAQSTPTFRAAGGIPFTYQRQGRTVALAFFHLPDLDTDDADALLGWARQGLEAARRQKTPGTSP